jgi:hypothetical protein
MPDRVHAAMHHVQPAACEAPVDRAAAQPELGQHRDRRIHRSWLRLFITVMDKCKVDPHRPNVPRGSCHVALGLSRTCDTSRA